MATLSGMTRADAALPEWAAWSDAKGLAGFVRTLCGDFCPPRHASAMAARVVARA